MHKATRLRLTGLNEHLLCALCGGYLVDATSIIECLHSFCRSCIIRYLETSKFCPICDVQVHKTRPLLNIRPDKTLQDLVYKLVPNLFKNEMKQRREFYAAHPEAGPSTRCVNSSEARGEVQDQLYIYTDDEKISLCLTHCNRFPPYRNSSSCTRKSSSCTKTSSDEHTEGDKRYLLCPAAVTVGHLKKFLKYKFDLTGTELEVGVFHSDENLNEDYTLMDIAYTYGWRRMEPLKLYYIVYDKTKMSLPLPIISNEEPIIAHGSRLQTPFRTRRHSTGLIHKKPAKKRRRSAPATASAVQTGQNPPGKPPGKKRGRKPRSRRGRKPRYLLEQAAALASATAENITTPSSQTMVEAVVGDVTGNGHLGTNDDESGLILDSDLHSKNICNQNTFEQSTGYLTSKNCETVSSPTTHDLAIVPVRKKKRGRKPRAQKLAASLLMADSNNPPTGLSNTSSSVPLSVTVAVGDSQTEHTIGVEKQPLTLRDSSETPVKRKKRGRKPRSSLLNVNEAVVVSSAKHIVTETAEMASGTGDKPAPPTPTESACTKLVETQVIPAADDCLLVKPTDEGLTEPLLLVDKSSKQNVNPVTIKPKRRKKRGAKRRTIYREKKASSANLHASVDVTAVSDIVSENAKPDITLPSSSGGVSKCSSRSSPAAKSTESLPVASVSAASSVVPDSQQAPDDLSKSEESTINHENEQSTSHVGETSVVDDVSNPINETSAADDVCEHNNCRDVICERSLLEADTHSGSMEDADRQCQTQLPAASLLFDEVSVGRDCDAIVSASTTAPSSTPSQSSAGLSAETSHKVDGLPASSSNKSKTNLEATLPSDQPIEKAQESPVKNDEGTHNSQSLDVETAMPVTDKSRDNLSQSFPVSSDSTQSRLGCDNDLECANNCLKGASSIVGGCTKVYEPDISKISSSEDNSICLKIACEISKELREVKDPYSFSDNEHIDDFDTNDSGLADVEGSFGAEDLAASETSDIGLNELDMCTSSSVQNVQSPSNVSDTIGSTTDPLSPAVQTKTVSDNDDEHLTKSPCKSVEISPTSDAANECCNTEKCSSDDRERQCVSVLDSSEISGCSESRVESVASMAETNSDREPMANRDPTSPRGETADLSKNTSVTESVAKDCENGCENAAPSESDADVSVRSPIDRENATDIASSNDSSKTGDVNSHSSGSVSHVEECAPSSTKSITDVTEKDLVCAEHLDFGEKQVSSSGNSASREADNTKTSIQSATDSRENEKTDENCNTNVTSKALPQIRLSPSPIYSRGKASHSRKEERFSIAPCLKKYSPRQSRPKNKPSADGNSRRKTTSNGWRSDKLGLPIPVTGSRMSGQGSSNTSRTLLGKRAADTRGSTPLTVPTIAPRVPPQTNSDINSKRLRYTSNQASYLNLHMPPRPTYHPQWLSPPGGVIMWNNNNNEGGSPPDKPGLLPRPFHTEQRWPPPPANGYDAPLDMRTKKCRLDSLDKERRLS